MSDTQDLLLEIGTEELPPKALTSLSVALGVAMHLGLQQARIAHGSIQHFATPRRLAVIVEQTALAQESCQKERRGPAVHAAFDAEGHPTRAAEGFARSCKVAVNALQRLKKGQGVWLVHRWQETGQQTSTLLPELVQQALAKLPIPKRMRWGNETTEFIRPVHWAVLMLGNQTITMELLGVTTSNQTQGHRFHHPERFTLHQPADYSNILEHKGQVIPRFESRRSTIVDQVQALAQRLGGTVLMDKALLDEVCALVEWPVALYGCFNPIYLALPKEVLISSMQSHQRYFPLVDRNGQLLPNFVTVSNIDSSDMAQVQAGNERVIRPRLSDAVFFWEQDTLHSLESRLVDLESIVFEQQLGSMRARVQRIADGSAHIAENLGLATDLAKRAGLLCKSDLLTQMVNEFPDLQGIMGQYYARQDGETEALAEALGQHYQPRFAKDTIPASQLGQVVSLADKLDTLTGIFGIGKPPSGDKDPYGLRRAALGVLRILIEGRLALELTELLDFSLQAHGDRLSVTNTQPIVDFMLERLRGYYLDQSFRPDLFEAVLACSTTNPFDFNQRLHAVADFLGRPEAASLAAANKRIRNILKKNDAVVLQAIQTEQLVEPEEKALYKHLYRLQSIVEPLFDQGQYEKALAYLAELKAPVDCFFDKVMVMTEDPDLRANRIALLTTLSRLFLRVADLSRIQSG